MGTFDSWGVNSFYFLVLDSSCGFVIRKFVKLQILVIYCCYLTNFSFLHLPLRSLTIFLVKLLRLPPNRKPCDFIKVTWFVSWIDEKIRQITNISDLLLLFDEFLFLTFAASQSDDFLVKLLRLPPNRKPCDFIKACYWIDQKILNSSN